MVSRRSELSRGIRILIFLPIPDPGVNNAPGSGSRIRIRTIAIPVRQFKTESLDVQEVPAPDPLQGAREEARRGRPVRLRAL